ncbi:hypothetical protein T484DRAFT_1890037, partial [Baffinella frigidus]
MPTRPANHASTSLTALISRLFAPPTHTPPRMRSPSRACALPTSSSAFEGNAKTKDPARSLCNAMPPPSPTSPRICGRGWTIRAIRSTARRHARCLRRAADRTLSLKDEAGARQPAWTIRRTKSAGCSARRHTSQAPRARRRARRAAPQGIAPTPRCSTGSPPCRPTRLGCVASRIRFVERESPSEACGADLI